MPDTHTDNPTADSDRPTPGQYFASDRNVAGQWNVYRHRDSALICCCPDTRPGLCDGRRKAEQIVASLEDYRKHFTDPFDAAEGGVVGEMVEALRVTAQFLNSLERVGHPGSRKMQIVRQIDAVLSQCKASGGQTKGEI